jgi:hypothetical protein
MLTGECNNNSQLKHELVVSASLDCTIHISPLTFQDEMPHGCHVIREHLSPVTEIRYKYCMRFEVLMVVKIDIPILWAMISYSLVGGYKHIRGTLLADHTVL